MEILDGSTLERIHRAAMKEFLAKGFRAASLRNIVKTAGVTTGAFYGYYASKEALFAALVDEDYRYLTGRYRDSLYIFESLPPEEQAQRMNTFAKDCMYELLNYMDTHRAAFHLLLQCAEGTPYAGMVDGLVRLEAEATEHYRGVLRGMGIDVPEMDRRLEHILITGMLNAYMEIIIHDMPMSEAQKYVEELNTFYAAGWLKIMGQ